MQSGGGAVHASGRIIKSPIVELFFDVIEYIFFLNGPDPVASVAMMRILEQMMTTSRSRIMAACVKFSGLRTTAAAAAAAAAVC